MIIADFGAGTPNLDAARQQCLLLAYVYAKEQASYEVALSVHNELLFWRQENKTWPPSWALSRGQDGSHLLVIEGTTSEWQGVFHFLGSFGRPYSEADVAANGYFLQMMEWMLADLEPFLVSGVQQNPFRISGHSYGGAMAFLIGCELRRRWGLEATVQVMTLGEPRSVTQSYAGPQPSVHWRLNSTNDIVPTLPPEIVVPVVEQWANPLNWGQKPLFWSHYGQERILYSNGGTDPEPTPIPLPEGVVNDIPASHYLPNYWARLMLNQQRFGGLLPGDGDVKSMNRVFYKFPKMPVTPNFPATVPGPDGRPVRIPVIEGVKAMAVILQPALMKHVWSFIGMSGESWTEIFYVVATSGDPSMQQLIASLPDKTANIITKRLALLYKGHALQSISASYVSGARLATIRTYNLDGTRGGTTEDAGPDVAGVALILSLVGEGGSKRKLWMRGMPDSAVYRNALNGRPQFSDGTTDALDLYIRALATFKYGILSRVKKPSIQQALPMGVIEVDGALAPGWAQVTTAANHGFVHGDQVILGQFSKKDVPAFNGVYTIAVYAGGAPNIFWIRYRTPSDAVVTDGMGYVRPFSLKNLDVISPTMSSVFALGVRQTKNPLSRSRAAQHAGTTRRSD